MFTIERNVPIPSDPREAGAAQTLRMMRVGESVVDTDLSSARVKSRWNSAANRQQMKVSMRQLKRNGIVVGYRIWRVK